MKDDSTIYPEGMLVKTKIDISGKTFGKLTVINRVNDHVSSNGSRTVKWKCQCSCGSIVEVIGNNLTTGHSTTCGCTKAFQKTHGLTNTSEYTAWINMITRCNNPKSTVYEYYGGRGVKVCNRWLESFENFIEDMGNKPTEKHSIERIDVNSNYCPENCIWETPEKQARNHRKQYNNTSGKTGVHTVTIRKRSYYRASWFELNGKRKTKYFNIQKYGEEEAFKLACDYRDRMIEKLNGQGAGYSEQHGL